MSAQTQPSQPALTWYSPKQAPLRLAGFAWFGTDQIYRRLPVQPPTPLPPAVNDLANCTAGGQIQFASDASVLAVRVKLRGKPGMDHMPSTGQCGVDVYLGEPGAMRYRSTTRMNLAQDGYEHTLFNDPGAGLRQVTLNLPLYQGVEEIEVGVNSGAQVLPPADYARPGRVIVYGTSITQGGCAARPGMAYTNILSRRLNVEFINLGFSGSGKGEPELAQIIAQIPDPLLYLLDYEANAGLDGIKATLDRFIEILRTSHRTTPIIVISRVLPSVDRFQASARDTRRQAREFQQGVVAARRKAGDQHISFVDGAELMGDDYEECTVDGAHPTDLGFSRMAEALEPVTRRILFGARKRTVTRKA